MEALGGLPAYQSASLRGEAKGGFNASTWVLAFLVANAPSLALPPVTRLLDVGAIVEHYRSKDPRTEGLPTKLEVTSIDVNPLSPDVVKADFFDFATSILEGYSPSGGPPLPRAFDVIVLSLVVNFIGDPWKRGLMLSLASRLLTPGGLLFLVLPSACVLNSRFVNQPLLTRISGALGLSAAPVPTAVRVTASLWMSVYVRVGVPDDPPPPTLRKRNEIRVGPGKFNNFAILLGHRKSLPIAQESPPQAPAPKTSNQRKKARKQKFSQKQTKPEPTLGVT